MVKLISWTGTEMYVADDRVSEYTEAGCALASSAAAKAETVPEAPKKAAPKKTTAKKTTTKK